jgi:PAS domain S-box-containing protein
MNSGLGDVDAILDADPDCIWILDQDGAIVHANRHAAARFGSGSGAWIDLWSAEHGQAGRRALDAAIRGECSRFRAFIPMGPGAHAYLESTLSAVRAQDQADRMLVRTRDVTADVETLSFFQSMAQLLPVPLTVREASSGRYLFLNHAAERLHDIHADESIGRVPRELFPADLAQWIQAGDRDLLASGGSHSSIEETIAGEDGAMRFVTHRTLTFDDGGPRHVITVCEDVTEQRRVAERLQSALDAAEAASRAKSAFLANMSHELRTPLNGVIAAADLLSRRLPAPADRELAELVLSSGRDLERLLSGVLDLARIEAGGIALVEAPFCPEALAREAIDHFAAQAKGKGLDLQLDVEGGAAVPRIGDRVRIGQVLANLLDNAVKFTERGRVRLALSLNAERLRFEVVDTGIGFAPEARERMFAPLQQMDESHSRRHGGAGLGLAICRELCALMGAELDCDGVPGQGARFWFDLDLTAVAAGAPAADARLANLRILAAEDHPVNRRVLALMLEPFANLTLVEDGLEALEMLQKAAFDVVLMDMQMPRMDGLEATAALRRLERDTRRPRTPLIMLSANTQPEHVQASLQAGADLHLPKPVTTQALNAGLDLSIDSPSPAAAARPGFDVGRARGP